MTHFNQAENAKVLVAEDTTTMRYIIKGMLKNLGFSNITEVIDGTGASREVKNQTFDLIICDWEMPGASGDEILTQARESKRNKDCVFIMCTGVNDPELVKQAIKQGVSNYIVKPLSLNTLKTKLEVYFSLKEV